MKTKSIHQEILISAAPLEVYETLTDSNRHARLTGCPAKISRRVGGTFAAMKSLRGKNLELVPGRKIVQEWQCDYEGWPPDHFSTLVIRLEAAKEGTWLEFDQISVPAACVRGIRHAWRKFYWRPLQSMFGKKHAP